MMPMNMTVIGTNKILISYPFLCWSAPHRGEKGAKKSNRYDIVKFP